MKRFSFLIIIALLPLALLAQYNTRRIAARTNRMARTVIVADTVTGDTAYGIGAADLEVYQTAIRYTARLDSLTHAYRRWHYTGSDTLSNPYYAALFASPTLEPGTLHRTIGRTEPTYGTTDPQVVRARAIDRALLNVYTAHPYLAKHETPTVSSEPTPTQPRPATRPSAPVVRIDPVSAQPNEPEELVRPDWHVAVYRPNFWKFKADLSLQFMQNYISENWYKGGESNNSFLANAVLEANYDNKRKLTFTNKLEMKLGFYSSKSDTIHKYKTNNDLLRMTNKLGLQASKHWYYTTMLQSWTQFYRGYKSNNPTVFSDIMSPFESVLSIGMTYKLNVKNFNVEATLSPLAADYKYVGRWKLAKSFGIDDGHHTNLDYGSTVTVNATWTPIKNVTWKARLYWFTDYSKTTVEWENTIDFKINDYLTTTLFLYPRFDDGVARKDDHSYLQFKEYLSLGFKFSF